MKRNSVLLGLLILLANISVWGQTKNQMITTSRQNTVKVEAPDFRSYGTGFFIDPTHIVTCFHVIMSIDANNNIGYANKIIITTFDGEKIDAALISIPTQQDPSPYSLDFAILKLSKKPKSAITGLSLYNSQNLPEVGTELAFSGFPLGVPAMVTHKGMLSGITDDKSIICVQASINKGNSGGALITEKGEVLGIVSMREGTISPNLSNMAKQLNDLRSGKNGITIQQGIGGVDTMALTTDLINTLDQYISTGIGYARSIKFVQEYLKKYPNLLK